jgi:hypothetical protein
LNEVLFGFSYMELLSLTIFVGIKLIYIKVWMHIRTKEMKKS